MIINKQLTRFIFPALAILALTACAPSSYMVKAPTPSTQKFQSVAQDKPANISLVDKRVGDERIFSSGTLPSALTYNDSVINPPQFLAAQVQAEMIARGVQTQISIVGEGAVVPRLNLNTFKIRNYRASAYSPFVTLTFLSAEIDDGVNKKVIAAFVKRGKVPVWSFEEIIEPTLNEPLSIVVKELSSKLVSNLYHYSSSDATVDELIAKIANNKTDTRYMDVYALGFTNNKKSIKTLLELTNEGDEYVRLAAISSLGTLDAEEQYEFLKSLYLNKSGMWQDRAMALKSIGDLDTVEGKTFLAQEQKRLELEPESKDTLWTLQVIRLYI